jgi:hypothetical protein
MRFQLWPPSLERNRPESRCCFFDVSGTKPRCRAARTDSGFGLLSASTSMYTMLGLLTDQASDARPQVVAGSGPPAIWVHVSPASVLWYAPEPGPPLLRKYGPRRRSQNVAIRWLGFEGSIARSTAPARSLKKLTSSQVAQPSVVL